MKKLLVIAFTLLLGFALVGCQPTTEKTQGIDDEFIYVGNTAATSGLYAPVGIPFNMAMNAVFDNYNATTTGRKIKLLHYDDEFDGAKGLALTKKLVEEDKVFALVGHFGTDTINATMDYMLETGIPMVYAATGVNSLFFENEPGNNILTVQPIYRMDGRMMVARALNESLFGDDKDEKLPDTAKIVVLYTDDDAGQSIRLGIQDEVADMGIGSRVTYIPFSTATAAAVVPVALSENPGVILLSANQAPATAAATALRANNNTAPVFTSYVNGAGVFTPAQVEAAPLPYDIYANAWIDIVDSAAPAPTPEQLGTEDLVGFPFPLSFLAGFTAEYWEGFVNTMNTSDREEGTTVARALWANPYAMAGYVAASTFVAILERVEDFDTLTWESFIELAESAPVNIPMGGTIDWRNGQRIGLTDLALNKFSLGAAGWSFAKVRGIEPLQTVRDK